MSKNSVPLEAEFFIDSNKNILKLFALIFGIRDNKIEKKKNTLISISKIKVDRLESVRLILFFILGLINKKEKGTMHVSLETYMKLKNTNNINLIKKVINRLKNILITYYDSTNKLCNEPLFKNLELINKRVHFQFNEFIQKASSAKGRGHSKVYLPLMLFRDKNKTAYKYNQLRFFLVFKWYIEGVDEFNLKKIELVYKEIYKSKLNQKIINNIIKEFNIIKRITNS